jgi:hypothetical protein
MYKKNLIKDLIKILIPEIIHTNLSGVKKINDILFNFIGSLKYKHFLKYERDSQYTRLSYIIKAISKFSFEKCKYLEIGVSDGLIFNILPLNKKNKFGVDPFKGGNFKMTSDEFFKNNSEYFDVIYIDGLHHYEQCQKDCLNALNVLNKNGIIIFHDFIPSHYMDEKVPRTISTLGSWTGDVWKVAVELSQSKNLEFCLANVDKGVGILKPKENYQYKKIPELKNLNFKDFYKKYYKELPIICSEKAMKFIS